MRLWVVAFGLVLLCALPGCASPKPSPARAPSSRAPDSAKGGVPDSADECPSHPEDYDGHLDGGGCPDVDSDSQVILDVADKCPWFLECEDGFEDDDGCPDGVVRVHFSHDSVRLEATQEDLIVDLATELTTRRRVAALRLDGTFAGGEWPKLAGHRARVVRDRLMHYGVPGSILTTHRLGQPVAAPAYVELVILKCSG